MDPFKELSLEELLKLIQVSYRYWRTNDCCFFLAGEENLNKIATDLNIQSCKNLSPQKPEKS